MKRCQMFFLCGLAVLFAVSANAAVPQTISYQGRLTDAAGNPVPNVPIQVKFTIWDAAAAGAALWNSGFQSVTPADGLFTYPLGSMVNLPDNLFTDTIRYLGITIGADPELVPRERFRTVPYAYQALRADTADISVTVFDNSITAAKLAANSVGNSEMLDNAIGSAEVINNSLTGADLAANSVASDHVVDNTLTRFDLAANSVTNSEIADNAVGSSEIATNAVGSSEITLGAVGASELATGSVIGGIGGDILDASITADDLASNSVGLSEMQNNAIGSAEVIDNSLTASDLATNSVGVAEIAANAVGSSEVIDNSLTAADLAPNSVGASELATGAVGTSEVLDDALIDDDIKDEPGVVQNVLGSSTISSTSVASMMTQSITAPTSGFILAIASCEASVSHSIGTTSSANFGVSKSSNSSPGDQDKEIRIPSSASTGSYDHVVMVHKIFAVPSGLNTIFFVGNKTSTSPVWSIFDLTLSLIFFPTSYGPVTETPPSPPGTVDGDLPPSE